MKKPPRFVLLDDDLFALEMAKKIVRNYSRRAEVISFSTCKAAIEYMEGDYFKGKYQDTVFLTDLHLPEIDGFALLDRMENVFKTRRDQLHIFVLSAAACPDEIKRVLSYNCVAGFYNKPLSRDKMSEIITCIQYPL
jgi:response regulator of citrate/malate metabolism